MTAKPKSEHTDSHYNTIVKKVIHSLVRNTDLGMVRWEQIVGTKYQAIYKEKLFVLRFDVGKPLLTCNGHFITEARWQILPLYKAIKNQLKDTGTEALLLLNEIHEE